MNQDFQQDGGGTLRIWNTGNGKLRETLDGVDGYSGYFVFSANSNCFVYASCGSMTQRARLFDTRPLRSVAQLDVPRAIFSAAKFSPDGSTFAISARNGAVQVWDTKSGTTHMTLVGHTAAVEDLAYSPDGKFISTGDQNNLVKLWDARNGQLLATFRPKTGFVAPRFESTTVPIEEQSLIYSGNSHSLLVIGSEPSASVYPVDFRELIHFAESLVPKESGP